MGKLTPLFQQTWKQHSKKQFPKKNATEVDEYICQRPLLV